MDYQCVDCKEKRQILGYGEGEDKPCSSCGGILKPLTTETDNGADVITDCEVSCPWDYLEEDSEDHFANYYAWEKWLQMKDRNDSLDDLDMMEKTLLYAIMVDLVKAD